MIKHKMPEHFVILGYTTKKGKEMKYQKERKRNEIYFCLFVCF